MGRKGISARAFSEEGGRIVLVVEEAITCPGLDWCFIASEAVH